MRARKEGRHKDAGSDGGVLIIESPDIESLGRSGGALTHRLGGERIQTIPGCRSDLLVQRIVRRPQPPEIDAPSSLQPWVEQQLCTQMDAADGIALVLLSLYGELLGARPLRHRRSGYLVQPPELAAVRESDRAWLQDNFEPIPEITVEESVSNLRELSEFLRSVDSGLVMWNVSTFDPTARSIEGPSTYRVRSNHLIASVEKLAVEQGIRIVDVDGAVAELGAGTHVVGPGLLSPEAIEYVTDEALEAVDFVGSLGQISPSPVMAVKVPRYDRRTNTGQLVEWMVEPHSWLEDGDGMFRVQFDVLPFRFGSSADDERRRRRARRLNRRTARITIEAIAGTRVYLTDILEPAGSMVEVDQTVALATADESPGSVTEEEATGTLRLAVKALER